GVYSTPTHQALPSCSIAVKAKPSRGWWPLKKRPALTASARAGPANMRSGREKACGAVEKEKGEEGRKKRKRSGGGLTCGGSYKRTHKADSVQYCAVRFGYGALLRNSARVGSSI